MSTDVKMVDCRLIAIVALITCCGVTVTTKLSSQGCGDNVIVESTNWKTGILSGGYNARINFKIPDNVKEYKVYLEVDRLFESLRVWYGSVDIDQKQYIFKREVKAYYNPAIEFTARYKSGKPKILGVRVESNLESIRLCGPGDEEKTKKTSTTPPTTTTPTPSTAKSTTDASTTIRTTSSSTKTTVGVGCTPEYDYSEVLKKSLLFYEAQRSGILPADNRVSWRHNSAIYDGRAAGTDLEGGYYDAGDYVKFGFPMASAMTLLAWGMIEFADGYKKSGQYDYGLAALKWGTDYFMKCHPSPNVFYAQVGNGDTDHAKWSRPEDMAMPRPSYKIDKSKPGSDIAGETAAALAAASIVFSSHGDAVYAASLLDHAKDLYTFAYNYRGKYSDVIPDAAKFYNSWSGYMDELAWSSLWLYKATGVDKYRRNYKEFLTHYQFAKEFSWDNKWAGVKVLAVRQGLESPSNLNFLQYFITQAPKTPDGLLFLSQWGCNRHAANIAFLSLLAFNITAENVYQNLGRQQINLMLGSTGRSYVVGFGNNPPRFPHHRSSSCPEKGVCGWANFHSAAPNSHVLSGALVGGPDQSGKYEDKRSDYVKNEVTLDYNAGFQSAIAGLVQLAGTGRC